MLFILAIYKDFFIYIVTPSRGRKIPGGANMNADYRLIGRQISMYRHRAGLTQEQLAEVCNLSVSYINRIENGHKKPSLDVLITIADTLGTTMNNLLSGNQQNDSLDCYEDLAVLLTDCTSTERRMLLGVATAVKGVLHNA